MTVYLDHNASAPLVPAARTAMTRWLDAEVGNPSSVHAAGRRSRAAVEAARRAVAAAVDGAPGEVIFTSGATEALHLAVLGWVRPGQHVVTTAVEHPALYGACAVAGARVTRVPVRPDGTVDAQTILAAVEPETALIAVMGAQNEIGTLYPVQAVAAATTVPVLCDAAQLLGRVPLPPGGCAAISVSAHKMGGPPGVGALWLAPGHTLRRLLAGGPQERGRRGGTENVPGILGFGAAAAALPERLAAMPRIAALRDRLEAGLAQIVGVHFLGGGARLANTSAFRFDGVAGDVLLAALDLEGVHLSSGSACSAGAVEPSATLLAMGLSPEAARGGLRASLGPETRAADIERCLAVLPRLVARIRRQGPC